MIEYSIAICLALICCLAIVYSGFKAIWKMLFIVTLALSSTLVFFMIADYAGKPIQIKLPPDIIVYGHVCDLDNGKIFLMFKETDAELPPIMIETDFNSELQQSLALGSSQMDGRPFRLVTENGQGGEGEGEEGNGEDGDSSGKKSLSLESDQYKVYALPNPILPPKNY